MGGTLMVLLHHRSPYQLTRPQVSIVKKKPKAKDEEKAEAVVPKEPRDLAQEKLQDLLTGAEKARTNSLKLSSIAYASELSQQLLNHAEDLEKMYKELSSDLKEASLPPARFKSWISKIKSKEEFGEKAKASFINMFFRFVHQNLSSCLNQFDSF